MRGGGANRPAAALAADPGPAPAAGTSFAAGPVLAPAQGPGLGPASSADRSAAGRSVGEDSLGEDSLGEGAADAGDEARRAPAAAEETAGPGPEAPRKCGRQGLPAEPTARADLRLPDAPAAAGAATTAGDRSPQAFPPATGAASLAPPSRAPVTVLRI
ncbi:hypothetical protein DN402_03950 [Streptomyces sp. SW4]|nr:hypothetical protein DN402_03950 [Streptomyces sp. SW4]